MSKKEEAGIATPHEHDVLSGRGNFVNYHPGNEHFRGLVRKHKLAYVQCPKPQKGKFSRIIYDEIKARDPPGRFLKQDPTSKLWYDIGEKKAMDKARQALREGAPEIIKEISGDDEKEGGAAATTGATSSSGFESQDSFMGNSALSFGDPYALGMQSPLMMSPQFQQQRLNAQAMMGAGGMMAQPPLTSNSQMQQQLQNQMRQQQQQQVRMNQQMMQAGMVPQGMNSMNAMNMNAMNMQAQMNMMANAGMMQQGMQGQAFNNGGGANNPQQLQAMQNKLASIYGNGGGQQDQFSQQQQQQQQQTNPGQQQQIPRQTPSLSQHLNRSPKGPQKKGSYDPNNPRRRPPQSLERQNSLESIKFEKIFNADGKEIVSPRYSKAKYEMAINAELQTSAMSLSLGDMLEDPDANLSSVFSDSLRISGTSGIAKDELLEASANMAKRRSTKVQNPEDLSVRSSVGWPAVDGSGFDMSVATLGNDMNGNMSFAMNASMTSFSGAFDENDER